MLAVLRWIVFLPAAFVASCIAGILMKWGGQFYSEFMGFVLSGAFSGGAFICVGLYVAPVRNNLVKWILIIISLLFGITATAGSAYSDDKLKMAIGISMVLFSLVFTVLPADIIVKTVKDANDRDA
jgi:hypothetical protein